MENQGGLCGPDSPIRAAMPASQTNPRTDGLVALQALEESQEHEGRVTKSHQVNEWLPWIHISIGNLKAFLFDTFQWVAGNSLQGYLDEFVSHFNHHFWELKLPVRVTNTCMDHLPVRLVAEKI